MITFRKVTKTFGDTSALSDVTFHIDKGEMVLITGPSGSGKTSLMRLLIKEYEPSSGEIIFDDESLAKVRGGSLPYHRRRIGVVFQDYKLLPELNIWENIALPLSIIGKSQAETESRVTDLLKLINLSEKAALFPSQLSGGEAQRVSIARALATGPSVIFADEPTGNLDPETSLSIARLLRQINRLGTTMLLATHDEGVLHLLAEERHLALHKGVLAGDSRPKKVDVTRAESIDDESTLEAKKHHTEPHETREVESAEDEKDEVVTLVEDLDEDAIEISIHSAKPAKKDKEQDDGDEDEHEHKKVHHVDPDKHTKSTKSDHGPKKAKGK